MNLNQIQNVYFIGIGGIGMSALARYFKNIGKEVCGYDKTATALTTEMIDSGINITFEDRIDLIPMHFHVENTLVVITPAIPITHSQLNFFLEREYDLKKRAQVLGIITQDTYCFAVAGTHGKTTTSAILGHILYESGADVTAFVGGIVENYGSNLIGSGKTITVVEADEFDRSFLHLHPDISCVTSMDADHLDIYGDRESIEASFVEFANKTPTISNLFIAKGLPLEGTSVGIDVPSDYMVTNIRIKDAHYIFDIVTPTETVSNLSFKLPGRHNLMNAVMAFAMANKFGTPTKTIAKALLSFKGIKRRFSYQIDREDLIYIDDYAHHPTEINAVYQAVTELYPNDKILAVFQPHLFSRTRDFAADFATSLSQFDECILLDIYPAREIPMEGITSQWLLDQMTGSNKMLVGKEDLISEIQKSNARIIVTIGAGDIGEMVEEIKNALS